MCSHVVALLHCPLIMVMRERSLITTQIANNYLVTCSNKGWTNAVPDSRAILN